LALKEKFSSHCVPHHQVTGMPNKNPINSNRLNSYNAIKVLLKKGEIFFTRMAGKTKEE
jgi:hypothetical protein